jgi:mRNA interferase MazF
MYQFGEVVLLEYPYTDLAGVKMRPAVVLKDTNDNDLILARATSQPRQTEYDVQIEDWREVGLFKPSVIRVHKLTTIEATLVKRSMGFLSSKDLDNLSTCLKGLFTL